MTSQIVHIQHENAMSNRGLMVTSNFLPIPENSWVTVVFKKYNEDGEQLYTITTETDGLTFRALRSPGTRDGVVGRDYELLEDPA